MTTLPFNFQRRETPNARNIKPIQRRRWTRKDTLAAFLVSGGLCLALTACAGHGLPVAVSPNATSALDATRDIKIAATQATSKLDTAEQAFTPVENPTIVANVRQANVLVKTIPPDADIAAAKISALSKQYTTAQQGWNDLIAKDAKFKKDHWLAFWFINAWFWSKVILLAAFIFGIVLLALSKGLLVGATGGLALIAGHILTLGVTAWDDLLIYGGKLLAWICGLLHCGLNAVAPNPAVPAPAQKAS